jgi:dimethylhistidine N-methyltransferase
VSTSETIDTPTSLETSADFAVEREEFLADVLEKLSREPKELDCKYLYDERGSRLFDEITRLPEYYLTDAEQAIMDASAGEMAAQIGPDAMLIEFGSGSSTKTRVLLDHLVSPAAYVPLDISEEFLLETAAGLRRAYPDLEILPVVADFTQTFELPESTRPRSHAAVYFPGSTIGNFTPGAARQMLGRIRDILGPQGGLLIGIDLRKDPTIIEAAYNDSRRVTDEFILNLLERANRELGADFDVDSFRLEAQYDQARGRVEIHLVSTRDQTVTIGDRRFGFTAGERVLVEYSHKYTVEGFAALAADAGFALHEHWTDPEELFAVLHLVNEADGSEA